MQSSSYTHAYFCLSTHNLLTMTKCCNPVRSFGMTLKISSNAYPKLNDIARKTVDKCVCILCIYISEGFQRLIVIYIYIYLHILFAGIDSYMLYTYIYMYNIGKTGLFEHESYSKITISIDTPCLNLNPQCHGNARGVSPPPPPPPPGTIICIILQKY